jgi:uncharacterized membrane protein
MKINWKNIHYLILITIIFNFILLYYLKESSLNVNENEKKINKNETIFLLKKKIFLKQKSILMILFPKSLKASVLKEKFHKRLI